ncbi:MAG: UDP-N-acetylmuramoyl-L-alanyl-D-glutamate--2,6-diaminopimelate ligase [Thermodesulfovibrionales bacterium]|jgi:UDP-N-acetylmuramoyl-L-alanyl-D-glutamate--2,6-diaminopimelate ligase
MDLREVITGEMRVSGETGRDITGIAYDSRSIKGGELFVATRGEHMDGHGFIADALRRGAAAIVFDEAEEGRVAAVREAHPQAAWIPVADPRDAMAALSDRFYREPSRDMTLIGITGTNGKTTTSYLIKSIAETWGKAVGLIGTISYIIKDSACSAPHTTPEAPDFQSLLRRMVDEGCDCVVTEVSSHALAQKRVDHSRFSAALFTNLTRDHLDFHHSMEEYFQAKKRLFTDLLIPHGAAVINADDPYGQRLAAELKAMGRKVLTYSAEGAAADLTATEIRMSFRGTSFTVRYDGLDHPMESLLVGMKNVSNCLSAIAAAVSLGIPWDLIAAAISSFGNVQGRFERVDLGQGFLAVVDYAHTGDALEGLLLTGRQLLESCHSPGRLITVFGCGGNRDRGKRPEMGRIASGLSDLVIVTSDNPRDEEPMAIIREIEEGIDAADYIVLPDRAEAIRRAVAMAAPGDMVVVAGKGHEDYQEISGERHHFSDREVLEDAIRKKSASVPCAGEPGGAGW